MQLYIRPIGSKKMRPVRELKAFCKLELEPGQVKEAVFRLDQKAFAYYEPAIQDWYAPNGEYAVEIGASSRDIRLRQKVYVKAARELPMVYTAESALEDLKESARGQEILERITRSTGTTAEKRAETARHMGKGAQKLMEATMRDTPLGSLVSFGRVTPEGLQEILDELNGING